MVVIYRLGCTSDWADNFDFLATTDDGSCDRLGCISYWADNYDYLATTDGGSCYRLGCMSDWADNYDYLATTDDGSCYNIRMCSIGQIIMTTLQQLMMVVVID